VVISSEPADDTLVIIGGANAQYFSLQKGKPRPLLLAELLSQVTITCQTLATRPPLRSHLQTRPQSQYMPLFLCFVEWKRKVDNWNSN
jgi:hypothetical protein